MYTEYHNCICTFVFMLYVLFIFFNIVCKIVRLNVNVCCKKFKFYKASKVLTIFYENQENNLRSHLWFCSYGPTEYAYAVGAWTLTGRCLLRHYIIETLISELRMTMGTAVSRIPDQKRDRKNPHRRDVNNGNIFPT